MMGPGSTVSQVKDPGLFNDLETSCGHIKYGAGGPWEVCVPVCSAVSSSL